MKEDKSLPFFITWTSQNEALTIPLERVSNDYFFDKNNKWLNLSSISYQASFGLKNSKILNAIKKQMGEFSLASPKQTFHLKQEVSTRLIEKTGSKYKCFFTLSGSEGIENALKMARQITGRKIILSQKNSYHGATMGALSITGDWRNKDHLLPKQWTKTIPNPQDDPNGEKLDALIVSIGTDKIAAICLETITGGNGVFIPTQKWYKALNRTLKKHKILLILDEVVCAGHRTGPFFGFQNYPFLKPDLIVAAKALTGGYFPLGVVLVSQKLSNYYDKHILSCGLTNYGHPLGLAALKAVLDLTEEDKFKTQLYKNIESFANFFELLKDKGIVSRSIGLLGAVEVNDKLVTKDLIDNGIYASIQNQRLILAPNLTMSSSTLKEGLNKVGLLLNEKLS